jgi:hypothetical protein
MHDFEKRFNGTRASDLANGRQVAGTHYRSGIQHWDFVVANDLDYFQGQITKYVTRWKKKNGVDDLLKAQHFLQKYIETVQADDGEPTSAYVKQE